VHNTLVWKTVEFDVAPGEHARFLACNKMGSGSFSMLLMIGVGPLSVTVERLPDPRPPRPSVRSRPDGWLDPTRSATARASAPGSEHRYGHHTPST